MLLRLPQGTIDPKSHRFACATCHHPHDRTKDADAWRATCSTAGCHPRAWNESRFHRLDPDVFKTCTNCHRPHLWKADGEDCASCHAPAPPAGAPAANAGGVTPAPIRSGTELWSRLDLTPGVPLAVEAMKGFPHDRHSRYDCTTCHDSSQKHATLKITPPGDCMSCHHGPPAVTTCATCHPGGETAVVVRRNVAMTLATKAPPRTRSLEFDHGRHQSLDCAACHRPPFEKRPKVDCTSCHAQHHRPEARCATCHEAPAPAAHPLVLHETGCAGSGCHATDHSAGPTLSGRRLCLTCHLDRQDHQPGQDCAGCHLVTFGRGTHGGKP